MYKKEKNPRLKIGASSSFSFIVVHLVISILIVEHFFSTQISEHLQHSVLSFLIFSQFYIIFVASLLKLFAFDFLRP